jgi:GMP synthase-like glutamine amidotransferase
MKTIHVVQHTSSEYLGLIEDHLEGRGVRFKYYRPFSDRNALPHRDHVRDGVILLGGGPWGSAGEHDLPTLKEEIALARACLMREWPIVGLGLGAQILATAAGGRSEAVPLTFKVTRATREREDALNGYLPPNYPLAIYMRDRAVPPQYAQVLARELDGLPALWQIGRSALGFSGHPGLKVAMIEDLVMEFEESPAATPRELERLRAVQVALEDALVPIMTGLVQALGWMDENPSGAAAQPR